MKNLIFSSVGDNTNFDNIWLDKDRKYDVFVIYYGDEEKNFKKYSKKVDYIEKRKGDKWQNFHYLYNTQYDKIQEYDRIFFLDDDIIISTKDINEMFKLSLECDLWICQPSFAIGSELGWDINATNSKYFLRYTNFVENNSCLMTKDVINKFMKMYDPKLISFGVDYIYMSVHDVHNPKNIKKFAIIDNIQCINPPGKLKAEKKIKSKTVKSFQTQHKKTSERYWPNNDVTNSKTNSREFSKITNHENRKKIFLDYCKKNNIQPFRPKITKAVDNFIQHIEHAKSNYSPFIDIEFNKTIKFEKNENDKIAFLFLTRNNLKQPKLWYDYLIEGSNRCNIYAHSKERDKLNQQFLIDAQIPEQVQTDWGNSNLVTATNLLIKNALKDPTNKYFILVSESCIPLYQFEIIYDVLINKLKKSMLYTFDTPNINNTKDRQRDNAMLQLTNPEKLNLTWETITKNSQWMILNRNHAKIVDKYNHENMWKDFNVADEWYYYNVINYYDSNLKKNIIETIKPTFFSYFGLDTKEKTKNLTIDDIKKIKSKSAAHPTEYNNIEKILKLREEHLSLFLRKITPNLKVKYEDLKTNIKVETIINQQLKKEEINKRNQPPNSTFIDIEFNKTIKFEKNENDKIAFLFLTRNNLKQPKLWYDYLIEGSNRCNIYAHSKERDKLNQQFLIDAQIPEQVQTDWGNSNLVTATNLLIKNALKDPTNKYFILVSESCIPTYNFNTHYSLLLTIPYLKNKSWLYTKITPKDETPQRREIRNKCWAQISKNGNPTKELGITRNNMMSNTQWVILNRDHAEIINKYDHLHLWKNFRVADEWYHYNILRHYDPNIEENTIQDTPPTSFMYIKGTPHPSEINTLKEFNDLRSLIPSLFIRKVSPNLNIEYKDITPPSKD